MRKPMKELTVDAAVENIEVVTDFVNEELEKLDCPVKARRQIDVAIDELFGNIARYAYSPDVGKATVRFSVEEDPLEVTITFIDNGIPFWSTSANHLLPFFSPISWIWSNGFPSQRGFDLATVRRLPFPIDSL